MSGVKSFFCFLSFLESSLNILLHFRIQYHLYNKMHIKILLKLGIFIVYKFVKFFGWPLPFLMEIIPGTYETWRF